jgi:hypothetical protein
VPGPALRDRPLHVQRQRQGRPAKAGRYEFNSNCNYARLKGSRLLSFDHARLHLRMNRPMGRFTNSKAGCSVQSAT